VSNYTKSTNFATKDALASGNPLKIVKGTEIDTEFNNIATAVATKGRLGKSYLSLVRLHCLQVRLLLLSLLATIQLQ
jgi:hypothetical protein